MTNNTVNNFYGYINTIDDLPSFWDCYIEDGKLSHTNARIPDQIDGLNITLFGHQCIAVRAMLDLEDRRKRIVKRNGSITELYTSVGILAEPFGSGKTIECLALIKSRQQPDFKPISVYSSCNNTYQYTMGYKLVTAGKLLWPNLIIVGASVFNQWLECIDKVTTFKVLPIFNNKTLRDFCNTIKTSAINNYDIVLVKSGECSTSSVDNAAIEALNMHNHSISACVGLASSGYIWSRVIIDDYDTIGLKDDIGSSIGRFTWYISATQKKLQRKNGDTRNPYSVIERSYLHRVMHDKNLNDYFKVSNDIEYVNECVRIYKPRLWVHYIKRKMQNIINYLARDGDLSDVCREMINSDAIGTLAEVLGLKTNNIMVIFEKVLSDKFDKYKETIIYHQNIKKAIEYCNTTEYHKKSHDIDSNELDNDSATTAENDDQLVTNDIKSAKSSAKSIKSTKAKLDKAKRTLPQFITKSAALTTQIMEHSDNPRENIKHKMKKYIKDGKISKIPYLFKAVDYLTELADKVALDIKEQDKALQRLRENFRNDECSVCLLEFENNVFLLKCCGYSICEGCVYKATQMNKSTTKIDGSCPNCKASIRFTDLITLDPNIDIKQLTDEDAFKSQLMSDNTAAKDEEKKDDSDDIGNSTTVSSSTRDPNVATSRDDDAPNNNELPTPYDKLHPKVRIIYDIVMDKINRNDRDIPFVKKSYINGRDIDIYNMECESMTFQLNEELTRLISSDIELDKPVYEKKKVIVFANYGESLTIVREQLPYGMTMMLQGTVKQMAQQLQEFRVNDVSILLINSQKHCAGINLQFASDLVFFHKIINPALEAQVEGRIQRPGRKYSANVHYLLYNTECI